MTDTANKDAILTEYNFIVLVDTSGSMAEAVKAGSSKTRWESMQESAIALIRDVEKFDQDGIDVVQLGGQNKIWNNVTTQTVKDLFNSVRPMGTTPTAEALQAAFKIAKAGSKKAFILAFTDGIPDDAAAVQRVIIDQANSQETDDQCTVLFVQVGDDASASKFLQNLDDNLKGAKFDIVDAKTMAEAEAFSSTTDMVIAAIND